MTSSTNPRHRTIRCIQLSSTTMSGFVRKSLSRQSDAFLQSMVFCVNSVSKKLAAPPGPAPPGWWWWWCCCPRESSLATISRCTSLLVFTRAHNLNSEWIIISCVKSYLARASAKSAPPIFDTYTKTKTNIKRKQQKGAEEKCLTAARPRHCPPCIFPTISLRMELITSVISSSPGFNIKDIAM